MESHNPPPQPLPKYDIFASSATVSGSIFMLIIEEAFTQHRHGVPAFTDQTGPGAGICLHGLLKTEHPE